MELILFWKERPIEIPAIDDIVGHQTKLLTACLNSYSYDPSPISPQDSTLVKLELELAEAREELCNQFKQSLADIDREASK